MNVNKGGHKTGWLWQTSWNCWHARSQKIKYSYCKNKISCSCLCFATDSNFPKGWRRWLPADFKQEVTKGNCKHIHASCFPGKLQDQTLTSWNKALHSLYLFWKQTHTSMLKQVKIFHQQVRIIHFKILKTSLTASRVLQFVLQRPKLLFEHMTTQDSHNRCISVGSRGTPDIGLD